MAEVPLNWCAVHLLLAIALISAVSSDTDISYQIGEFNNKLSDLHDRLNLFDYITKGNVSVLVNRVEFKDLAEKITVHMNESNRKLTNLEDKMNALTSVIPKQIDFDSKFNVFATRATSNVSAILHRLEEKESQCDEYAKMHMNESNRKLANLEDKIDTRFTDLEAKLNALAATVKNFVGNIEETLLKPFSSCEDVFASTLLKGRSGVYKILPIANSSPFKAYCMADPRGGLPWTVVQRRVDGTVNFYRNWTEYQRGFGDLESNFFLGLDHLHELTTKGETQELWVMLTAPDGISAHAYYESFAIGNEAEKYPLEVLGKYSGDAGDSLTYHKSMKFSTYDNINDLSGWNCAKDYKSAWWFRNCHYAQLNGEYGNNEHGKGLCWLDFRGLDLSMKYAHMAIRPARK